MKNITSLIVALIFVTAGHAQNQLVGNLTVQQSATFSARTSGRVPFFSTNGLMTDSSGLTFNSSTGALSATSGAFTALTISGTSNTPISQVTTNATSQLSIDTTAGNSTDISQINFKRNGVSKWVIGNNSVTGSDTFDIATGGVSKFNLSSSGAAVFSGPVSGITTLATTDRITINSGATAKSLILNSTAALGTIFTIQDSGSEIGLLGDSANLDGGTLGNMAVRSSGTYLAFDIGAVTYGKITATGLNACAIGATTPSTGAFTTVSASGQMTSTVTTGTAPFVVSSTTNVANLNASSLSGATFAAPGPIGSGTPSTGAFTSLSATGLFTSTISGIFISATGVSTSSRSIHLANTTGDLYFGVESSTGGSIMIGSAAYASVVNANAGKLQFGSGGTLVLTLDTSLNATCVGKYISFATGNASSAAFQSSFSGASVEGIDLSDSTNTSAVIFAGFRNSTGTTCGTISRVTTTNAVAYNTTSDARLKTNIRDFTDSGRLIDGLQPRLFDWKSGEKDAIGFVAQEENEADPAFARIGAVTVGDDDPETIHKQWQRSDQALVPIVVAEEKSLRARVANLESQNSALLSRIEVLEQSLNK